MACEQVSGKIVRLMPGLDAEIFEENARRFEQLNMWEFSMVTTKSVTPWTFWCIPLYLPNKTNVDGSWRWDVPPFLLELTAMAGGIIRAALTDTHLRLNRCLLNGKTYGQDGSIHRDNSCRNRREYTLLYYPLLRWEQAWEGETLFYDDAQKRIELAVPYSPNRFLLWDARIWHCGRAPSRICPHLRITMVWNFVEAES